MSLKGCSADLDFGLSFPVSYVKRLNVPSGMVGACRLDVAYEHFKVSCVRFSRKIVLFSIFMIREF